jgi:hypothetical protein
MPTFTAEESSLSSWAGPYVTEMLGRGQALAGMPYQAYMGPLTAGESGLQTQAYQGLGALQMPTSNMGAIGAGGSFTGAGYTPPTAAQAAAGETGAYTPASGDVLQQYMTPYLQGALQPQYDAARRQSEIQAQQLQSQFGKAGAYGGSRQGVAEAELQRGLLDRMAGITGTGYQQAFEQAQNQFNEEARRQMEAQQLTNRYGFDVAKALQDAGAGQRAIEQQGIGADIAQFEQERDYDKNNTLFMQSLLQSLPLETQSYSYIEPSGLQTLAGGANDVKSILDLLNPPNNSAAGGTAAGGTAATPQYDMNALANYKASYMASGMDEQAATIQAMKDIGMIK